MAGLLSKIGPKAKNAVRHRHVTRAGAEHLTRMRNRRSWSRPLAGVVLAGAASCWTAGTVTTAGPERLTRVGEAPGAKVELPASCVTFLAQVQCRLRAAGNDAPQVDRALAALRASFEAQPPAGDGDDTDAGCNNGIRLRRPAIEAAGCASAAGRLADLPPGHPAECAPREFFFVRRDGRVVGCRRDCATSQDCPAGTSCTAIGYAAGGPLDQPFCE